MPKVSLGAVAGNDFLKTNGAPHETFDTPVGEFSMARQEFAAECDINTIMEKYQTTGALPANVREPVYYDFTEMPDNLMDALDRLDEAQRAFMSLPAKVRAEFDNSAHAFVGFASDPANLDQMRAWGLAPPAPSQEPVYTPVPPAAPGSVPASTPAPASDGGSTQSST